MVEEGETADRNIEGGGGGVRNINFIRGRGWRSKSAGICLGRRRLYNVTKRSKHFEALKNNCCFCSLC